MVNNQFSTPFIVDPEGRTKALKRVSFANEEGTFNYNEEWLQNLLFNNPSSLPIQEIDTGYQDLIPICTELNTPAGPIDILYVTPQGKLVLLEAKLWRNPEARRKVIGQILDYAKELNRWDYEELQKQVSRRIFKSGNALYESVKNRFPDIDEADFVDEVSRSLRTGRFMLLIVGDGIREGAGAIAEFLDNVGYLQFSLGLVEVGIYETPQKNILVQPRVLAKTIIINRTVVELASPAIKIQQNKSFDNGDGATDSFYKDFWTEFVSNLELDDTAQRIPPPPRGKGLWFQLPPRGTDNAWINVYFAEKNNRVGLYFRLANNEIGELAYQYLEKEKETILDELPKGAEWGEVRGYHTVGVFLHVGDVRSDENREVIKGFFKMNLNAFVNTFRARMETIVNELSE
ncbi:DUF4268 domain-containing protein [Amphritea balenae]|uniref:DUF4268 domain-containing protein n=1 Tax=Amphritea balenae TaxID=452629 RepID=A0A3P1SYT5_9GAMM|nr:DUF4268 domain-containing protein [Amphritea balenae]RRD01283.1 DUF4268 domain-containing protein [Amphritea balenae]GGK58465.1 hypothetical protein GCM10007941_05770 [Amphritea balenae]